MEDNKNPNNFNINVTYINDEMKKFNGISYVRQILDSKTYKKLASTCQHDITDLMFVSNNNLYPNDRFSHCRGAAFIIYIANENTKKLSQIPIVQTSNSYTFIQNKGDYVKEILSPESLKSEIVTSILHDCSHFCFSHTIDFVYYLYKFLGETDKFNTMFETAFVGEKIKYNSIHENLQNYVIKNDPVLKNFSFNKDSTLYSIDRDKTYAGFKVSNLLTSDRMDYILRDSYSFRLLSYDNWCNILANVIIVKNVKKNRLELAFTNPDIALL